MIKTYYICTDNQSYEYAIRYYKDDETEILHCISEKEKDEVFDIVFTHQDKVFYFFGSYKKGFLKAEMSAIENHTDDYCEMYAIPHPEYVSIETNKPQEIRFTNYKDEYRVFARLNLK